MSQDLMMRKIAFYVIFLVPLLFYSCSPHCHQWKLAAIKANCPCATYTKVYLPTCNPFNGLEAVFISYNGNIRLYFNALTMQFPYIANDEEHTEIYLKVDEQAYNFVAERLKGGQTLLIPEEYLQLILRALHEKHYVEVMIGRYQAKIGCDNFERCYRSLISI
jgi:hypothetical protein